MNIGNESELREDSSKRIPTVNIKSYIVPFLYSFNVYRFRVSEFEKVGGM